VTHHLRAEGLTQAEVLQALREHGVEDLVGSKPPCWKSTAQSASCHGTHRAAAHDDASAAASTRPDWCALLRWLTLVEPEPDRWAPVRPCPRTTRRGCDSGR